MSKRNKKVQSVVDDHQALQRLHWRERECRFDISLKNLLEPVYGETFIDSLNDVEDTKGNPGKSGRLIVSNLRIIWHSHTDAKINISIGLFSALRLEMRTTESRLRGRSRSLFISARNVVRGRTIRYQFIFTNVVEGSPRLFTTIQAVNKAYDTSRLYREIRLRSSISSDYQLNLLPREHILESLDGVMNVSGDTGILGILCWTNIRVCWISQINELHNISLPYYNISKLSVRDSVYGRIVVLQSSVSIVRPKPYNLGFRIEPPEKVDQSAVAIKSAMYAYCKAPDFGESASMGTSTMSQCSWSAAGQRFLDRANRCLFSECVRASRQFW
eukprot:m.152135 g.152135  ORF g.152135 m.152135 type:complete len:330 (+) comp17888_c0_seq2:175-1164(+)